MARRKRAEAVIQPPSREHVSLLVHNRYIGVHTQPCSAASFSRFTSDMLYPRFKKEGIQGEVVSKREKKMCV